MPVLTMEFVYVEPGSFQMGSDSGDNDEKPVHAVQISQGFWMGKCEVTQAQYQLVMGVNPSYFQGADLPVERVSWDDAMVFCDRLTKQEHLAERLQPGQVYRLPTEAEWEYAARGGSRSQGYKYAGSNILEEVAWSSSNSGRKTHPVAQKTANELDLYDMSGNVSEWCQDWYADSYRNVPSVDPAGPSSGRSRVVRGCSWSYSPRYCRSIDRNSRLPGNRRNFMGFRVALNSQ
jgi:formylglycine-generating enzyme required for sulfatase activity